MGDSSALLFWGDLDGGGSGDRRCWEILARRRRAEDMAGGRILCISELTKAGNCMQLSTYGNALRGKAAPGYRSGGCWPTLALADERPTSLPR